MKDPKISMARLLLLAVGPFSSCDASFAVQFCATTANQIQSHLTQAAANGTNDEIRVAAGVYSPTATLFYSSFANQNLILSGGWDPTCTSQRRDPAQTVIDGSSDHRVLEIYVGTATATVAVRYLSLQNGDSGGEMGGGLKLEGGLGSNLNATVEHLILRNNYAAGAAGAMVSTDLGNLRLANNLMAGNVAQGNFAAASLTANGPSASIIHNTVVANTSAGDGTVGGLRLGGSAPAVFANNIFWGNEGIDLHLFTQSTYFLYANDVEEQLGTPAGAANNVSVAPEFAGSGDYRLASNSPLINAGDTANVVLPTRDIATGGRSLGDGPDLGAYESEHLFSDGFEIAADTAWFGVIVFP